MHYLPVFLALVVIKLLFVCAFVGPRRAYEFLTDFLTIGEDHWTWTTCSGDWFEDAEIELIEQGELVLRHRYGVVRLALAELTAQSRRLLVQTEKWASYAASVPAASKITPFVYDSLSIEAA